jgi:hypothetical protein
MASGPKSSSCPRLQAARDYKRLATTVSGLHFITFACLMLHYLMHPV